MTELLEPEDEDTTRRWVRPETLEDWPGQLRKGSVFISLTALAVALTPLILVLVWLMSR